MELIKKEKVIIEEVKITLTDGEKEALKNAYNIIEKMINEAKKIYDDSGCSEVAVDGETYNLINNKFGSLLEVFDIYIVNNDSEK